MATIQKLGWSTSIQLPLSLQRTSRGWRWLASLGSTVLERYNFPQPWLYVSPWQ